MTKREELKILVQKDAVKHGHFILASGKESDIYVDLRKVTLNPRGAKLIGDLITDIIKERGVDAIGGLTMGADPIALATSMQALEAGVHINAFVVRKEKKAHGTMGWIEGPIEPGHKAVVVEDVITTGSSAIKAIERLKESGVNVDMVVAVLDRNEGGREAIEALGYPVQALLTREDL
jgi:orotate phosphoribosyltransferase